MRPAFSQVPYVVLRKPVPAVHGYAEDALAGSQVHRPLDNREQRPYSFPCETVTRFLATGDYSILGLEDVVTVERKSKRDAYGTIGSGRNRFMRELDRMSRFSYAAIVVEASMSNFLIPPRHSKLNPSSAINSLLAWSVRYDVQVFFADSRALGAACVFRLLEKFWKYNTGGGTCYERADRQAQNRH